MAEFGIRFFLNNLLLCAITGILLFAKRTLKNCLSCRMQFNLWFLFFGLLTVPFLPFCPIGFSWLFSWFGKFKNGLLADAEPIVPTTANTEAFGVVTPINDFALSVSKRLPSIIGLVLCTIWLLGVFVMLFFLLKSSVRLYLIKKSALPLQNERVREISDNCFRELGLTKNIPIYSTAFIQSPVITGVLHPRIFLPIRFVSDCAPDAIRYALLHELQHYKHKDTFASCLINLFGILYWFNPLVWLALGEMQIDRELACDTAVLHHLKESEYQPYGTMLIDFAEKYFRSPFSFTAGISGGMKQMRRRILNISSYQNPTAWETCKGLAAFGAIAFCLFGAAPMLSANAAEQNHYRWNRFSDTVSIIDLSDYFIGYEGSFVLYDLENDAWYVHDMERAVLRTSPDSTYKLYSALFGLEEGIISPKDSLLMWDKTVYPFTAWNADQDLYSAMQNSVNWYFQNIDNQIGSPVIRDYIEAIGYGNEYVRLEDRAYWLESSLKISPVEQVQLLTDLYNNRFDFHSENIAAVKQSIRLISSDTVQVYAKTGTGRVDGADVNGWFIGYVETQSGTYFFAANIQSDAGANGTNAARITASVLSHMGIIPSDMIPFQIPFTQAPHPISS